jgi:hypothetical protein
MNSDDLKRMILKATDMPVEPKKGGNDASFVMQFEISAYHKRLMIVYEETVFHGN